MKKIIKWIIPLVLLLCSCGTYTKKEYTITVKYCINNSYDVVETFPMCLEKSYTPAYSYDGHRLAVYGIRGGLTSFEFIVVYQGNLPIRVNDFNYELKRVYKASKFDGHEIK